MTALHLAATGTPLPLSPTQAWRRALGDVEYWDEAVHQAHRRMMSDAPLGALLIALDVVKAAQGELAAALLRERRARLEATGRRWLASVGGIQ